jgi:hypothetical protein
VVDHGRGQFAVRSACFRTEQSARTARRCARAQGIANARVEPRNQRSRKTMLVVRDPQQPSSRA